jgi:hypothetical protein
MLDRELLARLTLEHKHGEHVFVHDALRGVVLALTATAQLVFDLPGADEVTAEDTLAGLRLLRDERADLDYSELVLIEAAKDRGITWEELGRALGFRSPQAMQQRYRRCLGGKRNWPTHPKARESMTAIDRNGIIPLDDMRADLRQPPVGPDDQSTVAVQRGRQYEDDPVAFGVALEALKLGRRITRTGWDDAYRWLVLIPGSTFTVEAGRPVAIAAPSLIGNPLEYGAHIDQFQGGVLAPWAATSADLLADDWRILPGGSVTP